MPAERLHSRITRKADHPGSAGPGLVIVDVRTADEQQVSNSDNYGRTCMFHLTRFASRHANKIEFVGRLGGRTQQYSCFMLKVGQNRIYTPYMTVYLVISLPKIPYIHRIYMVLANPIHA